jgi:hypothetical protein
MVPAQNYPHFPPNTFHANNLSLPPSFESAVGNIKTQSHGPAMYTMSLPGAVRGGTAPVQPTPQPPYDYSSESGGHVPPPPPPPYDYSSESGGHVPPPPPPPYDYSAVSDGNATASPPPSYDQVMADTARYVHQIPFDKPLGASATATATATATAVWYHNGCTQNGHEHAPNYSQGWPHVQGQTSGSNTTGGQFSVDLQTAVNGQTNYQTYPNGVAERQTWDSAPSAAVHGYDGYPNGYCNGNNNAQHNINGYNNSYEYNTSQHNSNGYHHAYSNVQTAQNAVSVDSYAIYACKSVFSVIVHSGGEAPNAKVRKCLFCCAELVPGLSVISYTCPMQSMLHADCA